MWEEREGGEHEGMNGEDMMGDRAGINNMRLGMKWSGESFQFSMGRYRNDKTKKWLGNNK